MQYIKLDDKAKIPTVGTPGSAGYDLYTIESYTLKPLERKLFKTGLSFGIPENLYGRIAPRSGLAVKKGIDVMAGVIDSDYLGEICVALINLGNEDVIINEGDKIAQIIFERYYKVSFDQVDSLTQTLRGNGGFGSTDKQLLVDNNKPTLVEIYSNVISDTPKKLYTEVVKERENKI